ncbi:MAG TPA: hypothetical protein VJU78_09680, partial [Chitinophagaceae bacterium]|nr:hypothetical protein [Chitinophagaceae bacterium]
MLVTLRDYQTALKKIKDNPNNHGFTATEYEAVMDFEKEMEAYSNKYLASFNKINEQLSKILPIFQFSVEKFEEKIADTRFVVSHDWFISFNLLRNLTLHETYTVINNKDKDSFETFILRTFPSEEKNIFSAIYQTVPHRKTIISEIESAYSNNHFHSVVVLCYTQVDGICNENLGHGFFDTDRKTNELKIKELEPNSALASKVAVQLKE